MGYGNGQRRRVEYKWRGLKGWHLPDTTEWQSLFSAVGGKTAAGKMLKSTSGWNSNGEGLNAFGFSALSAGYRDYRGGHYEGIDFKYFAYSVRCVKD